MLEQHGRLAYSLSMVLASIVVALLLPRRQRGLPLEPAQRLGIAIGGLVGATFAAKLPFILGANPDSGVLAAWLSDGKTILWGLAGGYVGVEVAKWSLHVRGRTGDSFVVPIALAVAIGRLGCLSFGCCYGQPTNQHWGVWSYPADGATLLRHPAPLYEFVFHAGFAGLAAWGIARGQLKDRWMLLYLLSYAVFRFVSETWREEPIYAWGMTFYQLSSIVIAVASGLLLLNRKSQHGVAGDPLTLE